MMNVTINDPIVQDDRREHFMIEVNYMHGDADAYSTETFFVPYSDMIKLEVLIRSIGFMLSSTYQNTWGSREQRALAEEFASSRSEHNDLYSGTLEDLRKHDTTDGSYDTYASIEDFEITYFDSKNVQRSVEYSLTGDEHAVQ